MKEPLEGSPHPDSDVFRCLFTKYFPKIYAMLIKQGLDRDAAEEIAQDTMLAVWQKGHQFSENRGTISAWIYAIARNLRIDRFRKNAAWQRSYSELEMIERIRERAEPSEPPLAEVRDIESALDGLPVEQLEVIRLSFIDGLTHIEIAQKLEQPLGTVKSRMRLAFKKLRLAAE